MGSDRRHDSPTLVVCGTDTDAGKTVLCALLLAAFPDRLAYWKPVETGQPDSETIRSLVPQAEVQPRLAWFKPALAPALAAQIEGGHVPDTNEILANRPRVENRLLLLETFGSPLSPLTDSELQVDYLRRLPRATFLIVTPSRVGAIGQTLQCCAGLMSNGLVPRIVVLLGHRDAYAESEVSKHCPFATVLSVPFPPVFTAADIAETANNARDSLRRCIDLALAPSAMAPAPPPRTIRMAGESLQRLLDSDRAAVWHPFTPLHGSAAPAVVTGAKDEFLYLADGRKVIDAIGSWWTVLHGHRYPPLVAAAQDALSRLDHVHFAGNTHPDATIVAERLLETAPWGEGGRVFFSDNGSTAVEVAIKLLYQHWCIRGEPQRTVFIGFLGGYHGDTVGAMSVSRDRVFFAHFEPLLFEARILPLDPQAVEDVLAGEAERVAGMIIEPLVQGASGMRMYSPELLADLAAIARRYDVPIIADEVLTGFYRTGTFWACEQAGVIPDFICTAKALAGGLFPCAATMVAPNIASVFDAPGPERVFYHGHTFTAHPVAMAVAARNLELVRAAGAGPVHRIERFFREQLGDLDDHPSVHEIRILGNIAAMELNRVAGDARRFRDMAIRVGLELGVMLRPLGSVVYAIPPWCTSEESLGKIADAFRAIACQAAGK